MTPGRIEVAGVINGDGSDLSVKDDTLDYLTFEVMSTTDLTVTVHEDLLTNYQLWLLGFIGVDQPFKELGFSERDLQIQLGESKTFSFNPGIYVAVTGIQDRDDNQFYNPGRGFVAVNPLGGGFTRGPYAYSLSGDIRALEFRDGELDGTFIITEYPIPEPGAAVLLVAIGAGFASTRRRRIMST